MEINTKPEKSNYKSAEAKALDTFAELMISKIQNISSDWKQPWFSPKSAQMPQNLNGRQYNGMNSIVLMLMQERNGWKTSRYATFDRISSFNSNLDREHPGPALDKDGNRLPTVSVKKGERSTPVMLTTFSCVNAETKEKIKYEDYRNLPEEERAKYNVYPKLHVYNGFSIPERECLTTAFWRDFMHFKQCVTCI